MQSILTRPGFAIGFFVFAMALIPLNDAFIKLMSSHLSIFQILSMRAVFCLVVLALIPGAIRSLKGLSWPTILKLSVRGFCLVLAMLFFFLPLATLNLAEVTAIFFTAPLLISLLSVPILGEKLGIYRIMAVVIGMAGVLVIVRPGGQGFTPAYFLPIISATSYACFQIMTRYIRNEAPLLAMVTMQNIVYFFAGLLGLAFIVLFEPDHNGGEVWGFLLRGLETPYPVEYLYFAIGGLIVLNLSFASANAYSNVEATLLAPFEYVALPMAVFWGIAIWGDWPDFNAWIGISMIISSGLLMVYRENRNAKHIASAVPMRAAPTNSLTVQEDELLFQSKTGK